MALKISINQLQAPDFLGKILGIDCVSEIYIKITRYSGEDNICRFILGFFDCSVDSEGNSNNLNFPEIIYSFEVNESEDENDFNVRKQAYEYLKTLPEFAGCEDC